MLNVNVMLTGRLALLPSAVLLLALSACSTPPGPGLVVPPPTPPSAPAVTKPPISGTYWNRFCADIETLSTLLKSTPLTSERCSRPGP
jgi:hypothetical protein